MNKCILVLFFAFSSLINLCNGAEPDGQKTEKLTADGITYTLFGKGNPHCEIIIPEKPEIEEMEAANLIKTIFQRIGNVDVPIVKTPSSSEIIHINIGRTQLGEQISKNIMPANLDADGYLIYPANENNILIIGKRPLSTFYGVIDFMEQYAGILWVWPNDNGIVIPNTEKLTVSVKKQISEPVFRARRFSGIENGQGKYWRINQESRGRREIRSQFSHNVRSVLVPEYWETHPEYFNMRYGKRIKPAKCSQACTSNPEVIKIFIEAAKKQFKNYPWIETFSVSPGDGGGFCECDACRALDIPGVEGNSDRYFTFANAVADGIKDEFPDKKITCLAYGKETCNPPTKVKLRPNVMPYLVVPSLKDHHETVIKWSKAARSLGVYFHLHGKAVPKFFPHKFAEYLKFLHEHNVTEIYAEIYQNNSKTLSSYELDGPRVWIMGKLLWNPYDNVDKLMEAFCSRFYGPAAQPMLRYYQQCEKAWDRTKDPFDFRREYPSYEFDIYTLEDINIMTTALENALKLAKDKKPVLERLKAQQKVLGLLAAYCQFEDIPKTVSSLPLNNADDAFETLNNINKRVEAAAKYNPEAPLRFISKDITAYLDKHFAGMNTKLGKDAEKFWKNVALRYPLLTSFIQPQILNSNRKNLNIAKNPGFEAPAKKKKGKELEADTDWESLDVPGWSKWIKLNAPGQVGISSETVRTGRNSLVFEGCAGAAGIQNIKVLPGQRYRISSWGKMNLEDNSQASGKLTVSWKNAEGKWLNKANISSVPLKTDNHDWQHLSITVTVPAEASRMIIMLGAEKQAFSEKTWFDDISIEPLYLKN